MNGSIRALKQRRITGRTGIQPSPAGRQIWLVPNLIVINAITIASGKSCGKRREIRIARWGRCEGVWSLTMPRPGWRRQQDGDKTKRGMRNCGIDYPIPGVPRILAWLRLAVSPAERLAHPGDTEALHSLQVSGEFLIIVLGEIRIDTGQRQAIGQGSA